MSSSPISARKPGWPNQSRRARGPFTARNPGPSWGRRGEGPGPRAVVTADQLHAGFQRCPARARSSGFIFASGGANRACVRGSQRSA